MKKEREEPKEIDEETLRILNSRSSLDPPRTAGLSAKAGSSSMPSLRRKGMTLPQRKDYGPPKKKMNLQLPTVEAKQGIKLYDEKKIKTFASNFNKFTKPITDDIMMPKCKKLTF